MSETNDPRDVGGSSPPVEQEISLAILTGVAAHSESQALVQRTATRLQACIQLAEKHEKEAREFRIAVSQILAELGACSKRAIEKQEAAIPECPIEGMRPEHPEIWRCAVELTNEADRWSNSDLRDRYRKGPAKREITSDQAKVWLRAMSVAWSGTTPAPLQKFGSRRCTRYSIAKFFQNPD